MSIPLLRTLTFARFISSPHKGLTICACSLVRCRSWHLPGNPRLVWHPARLINDGGCVELSMDTMHLLNSPRVLFGSEGSAQTFSLSPFTKNYYAFSLFFNNDKGQLFGNILWYQIAFKPLFIHSFLAAL